MVMMMMPIIIISIAVGRAHVDPIVIAIGIEQRLSVIRIIHTVTIVLRRIAMVTVGVVPEIGAIVRRGHVELHELLLFQLAVLKVEPLVKIAQIHEQLRAVNALIAQFGAVHVLTHAEQTRIDHRARISAVSIRIGGVIVRRWRVVVSVGIRVSITIIRVVVVRDVFLDDMGQRRVHNGQFYHGLAVYAVQTRIQQQTMVEIALDGLADLAVLDVHALVELVQISELLRAK